MERHQAIQEGFIENGVYTSDESKAVVRKIADEGVVEARGCVDKAGKRTERSQRRYNRGVKKAARHYKRHADKYQLAARLMAELDGIKIK